MFNASKEVFVVGTGGRADLAGVATSSGVVFLILDGTSQARRGATVGSCSGEIRLRFDGRRDEPSSKSEAERLSLSVLEEFCTSLPGAITVQKVVGSIFTGAGYSPILCRPRYVILTSPNPHCKVGSLLDRMGIWKARNLSAKSILSYKQTIPYTQESTQDNQSIELCSSAAV